MEPLGDWIDVCPWKSAKVLIIAAEPDLLYRSEHTVGGKRDLLGSDQLADGDAFIAVWAGEWRTTARLFGPGDREKVRGRLD